MPKRKKVIDIFPAKERQIADVEPNEVSESVPLQNKVSVFSAFWILRGGIGGIIVSVLGLFALHIFFANAVIIVQPENRELNIHTKVTEETIPTQIFRVTREATNLFAATGKEDSIVKARGMIRVYNEYSNSPQALVPNTRFISKEGKLFRSTHRLSVPGKGYADVKVVAVEAGEEYNIGPSNFSLPGLAGSALFTSVYGISTESMAGGSVQTISVVTKEDIALAKEELVAFLSEKAKEELLRQIPEDIILLHASLKTEVLDNFSLIKEGSKLNKFSYTVKVQASAFGIQKTVSEVFARKLLLDEMNDEERIDEQSLLVVYNVESSSEKTESISLKLNVSSRVYHMLDPVELRLRLRGASLDRAAALLLEYPHLVSARVSLWPFWVNTIPEDIEKIQVSSFLD
ncbi:hypothetical protein IIA94_00150 [Patescibacteria group bacterium]|nr:hypothetical protein [Patescibacteria group bacterium]